MTYKPDRYYPGIGSPQPIVNFRARIDFDRANSQSTVERDHEELLVLAELRGRLTDGVHRPHAGEWDDGASDLEWLAAEDYSPQRSVVAAGGAETVGRTSARKALAGTRAQILAERRALRIFTAKRMMGQPPGRCVNCGELQGGRDGDHAMSDLGRCCLR